jgi:hypothetical protein
MTDEQFIEYTNTEYKRALGYYDRRAKSNKRSYNVCSVYVLTVSIIVGPLLALSNSGGELWRWCATLAAWLSPSIALAAGLLAHFKFHENWLSFRSTWDALGRERSLHAARLGPYESTEDVNRLFVQRVEDVRFSEGSDFYKRHKQDVPDSATPSGETP